MASLDSETREQARLRRLAEDLLAAGEAPPTHGWEIGTKALSLLYRLASSQDSAYDALAVLHELQVHQVELDLQLQQLETNEEELTDELQRYRSLYEQAPVGYLLLRPDGSIIEANLAANRLFATAERSDEACPGEPHIDHLIRSEDRPALAIMLRQLKADLPIASCEVESVDAPPGTPRLRITATLEPSSDNVWMTVS